MPSDRGPGRDPEERETDRRNADMIAAMERGGRRRYAAGLVALVAGMAVLLLAAMAIWQAVHGGR